MARHQITLSPLAERVLQKVRNEIKGGRMTLGQAFDWVIEDVTWCDPDKPAYGRWSPVLSGILRYAVEEEWAAHNDGPGATDGINKSVLIDGAE